MRTKFCCVEGPAFGGFTVEHIGAFELRFVNGAHTFFSTSIFQLHRASTPPVIGPN